LRAYIGLNRYLELKVKTDLEANRRYIAFAWKADEEHFPQIARLFRTAAEAETAHAMNHLKALDEIKSTPSNLGAARKLKTKQPEPS
jgi:rubrerythrin